jgi:hypothetical protein
MYLIRDVFNAKPGRAKDLVAKFKKAMPGMSAPGMRNWRVMTDTVAGYWTVVAETEVENLQDYFEMLTKPPASPEAMKAMEGYHDLIDGGRREIYRIE